MTTAVKYDLSPPLRELVKQQGPFEPNPKQFTRPEGNEILNKPIVNGFSGDGAVQSVYNLFSPLIPSPVITINGIPNNWGVAPPDAHGEVGPIHYIQMFNLGYQIWNKTTGASILGPIKNNLLWAGFGGPCQTENAGDPVVLHDQMADRWMLTQFTDTGAPFFNCVAISQTSDPTGAYHRYSFSTPSFPDYPKYGIWPDAYYLNTRESGIGVLGNIALERAEMLVGNPAARQVRFTTTETGSGPNGLLPSDMDGSTLPPAGTPNFFVGTQDNDAGAVGDNILLYKFHVDWVTTANSTFTGPTVIPVAPFNSFLSTCAGRSCIPQLGTTNQLDHLGYRQRPTFRLAYRNFGTHASLVTNQSVEASPGMAGVRWYELRSTPPTVDPTLFQQGTYNPGSTDGIFRWMGSIAMDHVGNMALGYSVSNASLFPGVRYTGRLASDPLGTMPQGEGTIVNGTGSQTAGGNRWGDYSSMNVDPVDDCTFWYTTEWVPTTSASGWRGIGGAFKFPDCSQGTPTPTVTGTPPTATRTTTSTNTVPVPTATATVCASNYTFTSATGGVIVPGTVDIGNHGDDVITSVTLPFAYTVYDMSFTTVNVSSNGNLQFNSAITGLNDYINACLPVTDRAYSYTIYAFWDDQITAPAGKGVFSSVTGVAPNRIFGLDFRTCGFSTATTCAAGTDTNYQIRLYEGQTKFDIIYGVMGLTGSSATTGVQKNTTVFAQYTCNTAIAAGTIVTGTLGSCATATPGGATATATSPAPTATATTCAAQPAWQSGPSQAPGRYTQQGAVGSDGNFYVAGGQDAANAIVGDFSRFNSGSNTWTSLGNIPAPAGQVSVGAAGTKIYVAGGFVGGTAITSTLRIYDIPSNTWTFGASMPASVEAAAGVVLSGKFYVIGGDDFNASVNSNYIYDIALGTWSTGPTLPAVRTNLNGTAAGGLVYVYGGADAAFAGVNSLYSFNPGTSTWTTLLSNPLGTNNGNYAPVTTYGAGTLLVAGGSSVSGTGAFIPHNFTYLYNIAGNSWSAGPNMISPRTGHALGTLNDGRVIAYSGLNASPATVTTTSELLAPAGGCVTPTVGPSSTPVNTAVATNTVPPTVAATATTCAVTNVVADGGFEGGTPSASWTEKSTNFGTPLCDAACGNGGGTAGQRTGAWWVWFGGTADEEDGAVSQTVNIPAGGATLQFYLWIGAHSGLGTADFMRVLVGGTEVFRADDTNTEYDAGYTLVTVPIAATGNVILRFEEHNDAGTDVINFNVDDVTLNTGGGCATATVGASSTATTQATAVATSTTGATSVASSTATVGPTACPIQYVDVPPGSEFYPYIRCLACRKIANGYACGGPGEPCDPNNTGYFRPFMSITRGQIAKMVSNAAGFGEDPGPQIFEDVPVSHPFYAFINRLTMRGHMGGYACGGPGEPCVPPGNRPYFRSGANATRGQVSKIVANAAGITTPIPAGTQTYEDVPSSNPFWVYIERLSALGVMGGYLCGGTGEPCVPPGNRPYFRPFAEITRAQTSKIVANTFYPNCQTPVRSPSKERVKNR